MRAYVIHKPGAAEQRVLTDGELNIKAGPRFAFEDLQRAHLMMDQNRANGKIVIEIK